MVTKFGTSTVRDVQNNGNPLKVVFVGTVDIEIESFAESEDPQRIAFVTKEEAVDLLMALAEHFNYSLEKK